MGISFLCSAEDNAVVVTKIIVFISIICVTSLFSSTLYTTLYLYAHTRRNPDYYYQFISQIVLCYSILILFSHSYAIPYLSVYSWSFYSIIS